MSSWLHPVCAALDAASQPLDFFFRDDDAGWADDRLCELLDIFERHSAPVDLAAIPMALTSDLAANLSERISSRPCHIGIHQHGFGHFNHESAGRKCEFGPSRTYHQQRADIEQGRNRLRDLFEQIDAIFTPPWNRCTAVTAECLAELGFEVLSRESGAAPLANTAILEVPIHLDWFAHKKHVRLSRNQWAESLANRVGAEPQIGIMFHHAVMDSAEMSLAGELLAIIGRHPNVRCKPMLAIAHTSRDAVQESILAPRFS
jgi:hypothetical protein